MRWARSGWPDAPSDCWGDQTYCCPQGEWSCGEQRYACAIAAYADPSIVEVDTKDYDCYRDGDLEEEWAHWVKIGRLVQLVFVLIWLGVYIGGLFIAVCGMRRTIGQVSLQCPF